MKALIVDDSHFIREYTRLHLERLGWVCTEAHDGLDGVSCMREAARAGEAFDLMLVDVNMPVLGGLACVKQVQDEHLAPGTMVMMVTTEADNSYIRQALENGADEFLMKPFSPQSLREKLALLGFERAV
jgi:two-component system, chemotaxis family, chemotaxis protein CheY